jgi:hypothetical protein
MSEYNKVWLATLLITLPLGIASGATIFELCIGALVFRAAIIIDIIHEARAQS